MKLIDGDKLYDALADKLSWLMGYDDGEIYLAVGTCIRDEIESQPERAERMKWIPCEDRLPEESDYYMACIYDEDVDDYDFRKTWFAHEDDYDMDESEWRELQPFEKVVAWMPLMKPYKEVENE